MRLLLVLPLLCTAACRTPAISCELAGDHLHALINAKQLRVVIADLCTEHDWSASARACVASVPTVGDLRACADDLGPSAELATKAVDLELHRQADAARAEDERRDLRIDLPGDDRDLDVSKASLVVVLSPDKLTVGGKELADDQLDSLFRAAYARDHRVQLVVEASREIPHRRVIQIMERAKLAGITRLAIGTHSE